MNPSGRGTGYELKYRTQFVWMSLLGSVVFQNALAAEPSSPQTCMRAFFREALNRDEFGKKMAANLDSNLFDLPVLNRKASRAQMDEWVRFLDELPLPKSERVTEAPEMLVRQIFTTVRDHPVSSFEHLAKYDPDGDMGFCFGRATAAHLTALKLGVDKRQILKVWVKGTLQSEQHHWRYHVATLIRGKENSWKVIDPIFPAPLDFKRWLFEMVKMNPKGDLQTVLTEAKRFAPSTRLAYREQTFKLPAYRHYFEDLLAAFQEESKLRMKSE